MIREGVDWLEDRADPDGGPEVTDGEESGSNSDDSSDTGSDTESDSSVDMVLTPINRDDAEVSASEQVSWIEAAPSVNQLDLKP